MYIFSVVSQHDVLLLRTAFYDIEYPIQPAFVSLLLHIGTYMVFVDLCGFGNHAYVLRCVFFNMLLGTRIDQIEL